MNSDNSATYYFRREQQALALARAAVNANIRAIHMEMAEQYGRLASECGSHLDEWEKFATG